MFSVSQKIIRSMSTKMSKMQKSSAKLAKAGRVQELRAQAQPAIPDIEDIVKVQYFSPVQTRQQRKINLNPPKLELQSKKPRKQTTEDKQFESTNANKSTKTDGQPSIAVETAGTHAVSADINKRSNWEPQQWKKALANIRKMRTSSSAPVDSMGCDKCADENADEKTQRFHKLVALMLSSQTKDETTYEAMQRLKTNTLTPQHVTAMETTKLEDLLRPVSFYKNKAKYLQQTSRLLIDKYDADIPNNIKELVALPGVGPKMAHICMATAWNEITGIGVDVHVHRITNRLKWLPKKTKDPEQTRNALEAWLPRDLWSEVNHLLVGFGQTVCTPLRPHCGDCLNREFCPAAENSTTDDQVLSPIKKFKMQKKKMPV